MIVHRVRGAPGLAGLEVARMCAACPGPRGQPSGPLASLPASWRVKTAAHGAHLPAPPKRSACRMRLPPGTGCGPVYAPCWASLLALARDTRMA